MQVWLTDLKRLVHGLANHLTTIQGGAEYLRGCKPDRDMAGAVADIATSAERLAVDVRQLYRLAELLTSEERLNSRASSEPENEPRQPAEPLAGAGSGRG